MHKGHLLGCGLGLAVALILVVLWGGSGGTFGVLVAALVCPVLMVGAMWVLMSSSRGAEPGAASPPADEKERIR